MYHINRIKNKNHMIISINLEKPFDKVQHLFMIKTLNNLGTKGNFLIKVIYEKSTLNITLSGENESLSPKIKNKMVEGGGGQCLASRACKFWSHSAPCWVYRSLKIKIK